MKRTNKDEARLREAELLLGSWKPDDQHRAEEVLRALSSSPVVDVASRAQQLLWTRSGTTKPVSVDPALEELELRWLQLRSPLQGDALDGRFVDWFAYAEARPELLQKFSARLREIVSGWVTEYSTILRSSGSADPRVTHFDEWSQSLSRYPVVNELLRDSLKRARVLRAERLLAARSSDIQIALDRGDVAEAFRSLSEVESLKEVPDNKVAQLREEIYKVGNLQKELERWRSEIPATLNGLHDLERAQEIWRRGQKLQQMRGIPAAWVGGIKADLDRFAIIVSGFTNTSVALYESFDHFRSLLTELLGRTRNADDGFERALLEPVGEGLAALLAGRVAGASDPTALKNLCATPVQLLAGVPASMFLRVREELRRIDRIVVIWERLAKGELPAADESELDPPPRVILPAQFREDLERYRRVSQELEAIRAPVAQYNTTAERLEGHRRAVNAVERLLEKNPVHLEARRLLAELTSSIRRTELDGWIETWQMDKAAEACRGSRDGASAELLPLLQIMGQLKELRTLAVDQTDLRAMITWWSLWKETEAKLPAARPDSVDRALGAARHGFINDIRAAFAQHIRRQNTAEQDKAITEAIAPFASDLGLDEEYAAFLNTRQTSEIMEFIERRDWSRAEATLQKLGRDADAVPRLRVVLDVRRAQAAGVSELAALLRERWGLVERYLPDAAQLLLEAFARAWDAGDDEALSNLEEVALRVLARSSEPVLAEWVEWLGVEDALVAAATPQSIARLRPYLRSCDPAISRRLARVIEKWREKDDTVALTWAYRAMDGIDPPVMPGSDPLAELTRQSEEQLVLIVQDSLAAEHLDADVVQSLERRVRSIDDAWNRLNHLLLSVYAAPQAGGWPSPPASLKNAQALLAAFQDVSAGVASLRSSDLRSAGKQWDDLRKLVRGRLRGVRFVPKLDQFMKKVEPLTRMQGLESNFKGACERCGSLADQDLDTRDVFNAAAAALLQIIGTVEKAGTEGMHTAQVITAEYWRVIPPLVGDLTGMSGHDLNELVEHLQSLQENERLFRSVIDTLWDQQPPVGSRGDFDPDIHQTYLQLYPAAPPRSKRVWTLWQHFAERYPQPAILARSREQLPEWVRRYVNATAKGESSW